MNDYYIENNVANSINSSQQNGFVHSTAVPKIYKSCAKVLREFKNGKGSLQTILFTNQCKDPKRVLALTSKTASRYEEIKSLLKKLNLYEDQPRFDPYLAIILASEIIEKGKHLQGNCRPVITINTYADEILSQLSSSTQSSSTKVLCPKYARINTLKTSSEFAHKELSSLDFFLSSYDKEATSYSEFLEKAKILEPYEYIEDYHIPNLLVFNAKQEFWNLDLYKNGSIIIQDKASCIPAYISGAKPGDFAVDACSAPGNKTTHLAAIMENQGSLIAVEQNRKRFQTMKDLVFLRRASCVRAEKMDFIKMKPSADVRVILVDPSCSASGTSVHDDIVSKERIEKLSFIQLKLLSHALSFPNVRTVIYSTCSVNDEENEQVVEKALQQHGDIFKLKKLKKYFPGWSNSGKLEYNCGSYCVRTEPLRDLCQGFFVAKFRRKCLKDNEEEPNLTEEAPESPAKKKRRKK